MNDNGKLVEVDKDYLREIVGNISMIKQTDDGKIIGTLLENGSVEMDLKYSTNTMTISGIPDDRLNEVKITRNIRVPKECLDIMLSDIEKLERIRFEKGATVMEYIDDDLKKTPIEKYIEYRNPVITNVIIRFVPVFNDIFKLLNIKFSKDLNTIKVVSHFPYIDGFNLTIRAHIVVPIENYDDRDNDNLESVLCFIGYENILYAFIVTAITGHITIER